MSIKSLLVDTKEVELEFPGLEGFKVRVGAISREMMRRLHKDSTKTVIDSRLKMPVEKLDEEKFAAAFCNAAVKGWSGLTYTHLSELLLIDTSDIPDMEEEISFDPESAMTLIRESQAFDSWLNEVVFDIAKFRKQG